MNLRAHLSQLKDLTQIFMLILLNNSKTNGLYTKNPMSRNLLQSGVRVELETAEQLVEQVLKENTKARGDDSELIFACWQKQGLKLSNKQKQLISDCYSSETLTRCRRKLQARGMYLPHEERRKERVILEKRFKAYFKKN